MKRINSNIFFTCCIGLLRKITVDTGNFHIHIYFKNLSPEYYSYMLVHTSISVFLLQYSNSNMKLLLKDWEGFFKPSAVNPSDNFTNILICQDRYRTLMCVIIFHLFTWIQFQTKIDKKASKRILRLNFRINQAYLFVEYISFPQIIRNWIKKKSQLI